MAEKNESFFPENWKDVTKVRSWLQDDTVTEVKIEPWTSGGGLNADSFLLHVSHGDNTTAYFVKFTREAGLGISQSVGLAREAIFYNWAFHIPPVLPYIPKVLFAHGDMTAARKVTALELIPGDQAGFFFGSNSLHNWGKDLAAITSKYPGVSERDVTLMCFKAAATLQAPFWNKADSLAQDENLSFLRCGQWIRGEGRESWDAVAGWAIQGWARAKGVLADKGVKMPQELSDIMDASIAKTTWDAYQDFYRTHTLTLCHGDFHPSNMIVRTPDEAGKVGIVMVDWEVVGIGSGPQDLGQFMISHSFPESRRSMERDAVQHYVETLHDLGVEVSFDDVWTEYTAGGLGRFVWMLGIMIGGGMPVAADQYFVDQVAAFAHDHGFSAQNAPLMRI